MFHIIFSKKKLIKMGKKIVQQLGLQICSSKRKANQQSAPLETAFSTPEKLKKPKAAEAEPTPPPVSTAEK
jgi:hypothetical protein